MNGGKTAISKSQHLSIRNYFTLAVEKTITVVLLFCSMNMSSLRHML